MFFFWLKFINFCLDPSARLTGTLLLLTSAVTGNMSHCTMLTLAVAENLVTYGQTDGINRFLRCPDNYTNHGDDSDGSDDDDSGVSLAHPPHQVALRASAGGGQWN